MPLIINGQTITHDELYREMEQLKAAARGGPNPPNCCERDVEFMGYAKENMTARVLLTQEADRRGVVISGAEVDEAFEKIKTEAGGEEHFYINYNTSKEEEPRFKESVGINLRLQKLIEVALGPKREPDAAELQAYYQEHIDRYMNPVQIRVSHILKSVDHGKVPREVYAELLPLRQRIMAGESFAELADTRSDKPGEGGDLGFFSRGELVEEFEAVVFSMNPGEVSPIFLSPFGYHIATVTDRKEATPRLLEEIRDQVIEHYREETHQQRTREFVDALKANARIDEVDDAAAATTEQEHARQA
jgi:parvulin-like peptidyl-prolyl isomerase